MAGDTFSRYSLMQVSASVSFDPATISNGSATSSTCRYTTCTDRGSPSHKTAVLSASCLDMIFSIAPTKRWNCSRDTKDTIALSTYGSLSRW